MLVYLFFRDAQDGSADVHVCQGTLKQVQLLADQKNAWLEEVGQDEYGLWFVSEKYPENVWRQAPGLTLVG